MTSRSVIFLTSVTPNTGLRFTSARTFGGTTVTRRQLSEAWRTADGQAIAASAVVLVLGAIIVRLLTDRTGSGTPITALLVITVIIYALVSGRLSEFSAPGGWRAKFSEAADRPVTLSSLVIGATSLELHEIPKADFSAVKAHLGAEAGRR